MRALLSALSCALLFSLNLALPIHADDLQQAAAATVAAVPSDQFTLAGPRAAGDFVYGTHVTAIDHAPLARNDGFKLMWAYVPWQQVEPERGQFLFRKQDKWGRPQPNALSNVVSAAADAGMKLILRIDEVPGWAGGDPAHLDPKDLEAYLYEAVRYGKGTIQYVEVFNEPNLPYEWGGAPDPAAYARLLAAAYNGVKRADPNVAVVSGAVSQRTGGLGGSMEDVDWLDGLYRAGAAGSFDLLGMHAYLGSFAPETDPSTCSPMCFRDVERFREVMVRNGDGNKQALITEMGALPQTSVDLGPYAWMELAPDVRADYLVRALQMANGNYPWIRGAMVFNFDYATVPWNPRTSEKYWFSLLQSNGSSTPALDQIAAARRDGRLP
jgi:polysaccharide biosynthesis protein PslG